MSNANGKIFGYVSQADIKAVLGITTNSLASACQSDAINPRAACKPTNFASLAPLTLEQRKSTNYSTLIATYTNPIQLLRDYVGGNAYLYNRPNANFRMLDFKGYNHNAADWIKTIVPGSTNVNASCPIDISGNEDALSAGMECLLDLMSLGYLADVSETNLQFGFLLRNSTFTSSVTSCYWVPVTGMQTIRDLVDNNKLSIPANVLSSAGTWYALPCFTSATYTQNSKNQVTTSTNNGVWFPIPYCPILAISVKQAVVTTPVDYINIDLASANVEISAWGEVSLSSVSVAVSNANSSACNVVISSATIDSGVIAGSVSLSGGSASVPANSSRNITIQSSTLQFEVADPSIERIAINVEYYVSSDSSKKKSKTIYIEIY